LAGYANRKTPYEKVVGDIYVKALALEPRQPLQRVKE